jgi:hypothetical protein
VSVRVPHAALPCSALRCDMAMAHPRRACGSQVRSPKTPPQKNVLLVHGLSSAQPENSPSKKCFAGSVRVSVRVPHAAQPRSALRCDMALAHPRRACGSQVRSPKTPPQKNVLLVGQEASE